MKKYNYTLIITLILLLSLLSNRFEWEANGTITENGLLIHYTMDEIVNGKVIDSSGNGYNGKVIGNPEIVSGIINKAINFTGNGQYIDTGVTFQPSGSFSISIWFKHSDSNAASRLILGNDDYSNNGRGIELGPYYENLGNYFRCAVFIQGSWYQSSNTTSSYNDNQWHNVILVFKAGASLNCYIDGQSLGNVALPSSFTTIAKSNANLHIGDEGPLNMFQFKGQIDDVKIFTVALTSQNIESINQEKSTVIGQPKNENVINNILGGQNLLVDGGLILVTLVALGVILIIMKTEKREKNTQKGIIEEKSKVSGTPQQKIMYEGNYCIKCHMKIELTDKICQNCGTPIILVKGSKSKIE